MVQKKSFIDSATPALVETHFPSTFMDEMLMVLNFLFKTLLMVFNVFLRSLKIVFSSLFDMQYNATVHFPASCSYISNCVVVKVQLKYVPLRPIGFDFSDVA